MAQNITWEILTNGHVDNLTSKIYMCASALQYTGI